MDTLPHVCLPVNVDAFVLNEEVCTATGLSLVAPITQPDYVSLRLSSTHVQHDILPTVDLHNAQTGLTNPRISSTYEAPFTDAKTDPEPPIQNLVKVDRKRLGIYLHWTVPRAYRSATSAATPPPQSADDKIPPKTDANPQPVFPSVPNRWLVIRILHPGWLPQTAKPDRVSAWVIESDRLRKVEELNLDENGQPIDLETDVAPFVAYAGGNAKDDSDVLNSQAENYVGYKESLATWRERKPRKDNSGAAVSGFNYIDLTVMNSSNPVFADYTAHNANVFSIKDNLYDGNDQYLDSATCDYIVLGWHSDHGDDPLWYDTSQDLASRLQRQFCAAPAPQGDNDSENAKRCSSRDPSRLICHAAKFNVKYSPAKPDVSPGDVYAANFTKDVDMEPVAVGTSPLDAVLAFFQAHSGSDDPTLVNTLGDEGSKTAAELMGIRELLYATEDDYDSRIKAADLVFANNFANQPGGFVWRYSQKKTPDNAPIPPSSVAPDPASVPVDPKTGKPDPLALLSEVNLMAGINNAQRTLDSANSQLGLIRWNLFAEWFKYVSDPLSGSSQDRIDMYTSRVPPLRDEAQKLAKLLRDTQDYITSIEAFFSNKNVDLKKVARDPYYKRTDPTLCLAGIDAGWDPEYLTNTSTRFADRLSSGGNGSDAPDISGIINLLQNASKFSSDQKSSVELAALSTTLTNLVSEASKGYVDALGFKTWTGQPFAPQFVEWEGIYYHVPWSLENWDVELVNSALASSNHKQVMYSNPSKLSDLPEPRLDSRSVSGRMLVLPQPSFALGAIVAQVLDASNDALLPPTLQKQEDKDKLIAAAKSLKFISGEMTGVTEALLTMANGQHVKPNVREQGQSTVALKPSIDVGMKITMVADDFHTIAGESGLTPYGTLVRFSDAANAPNPFKGVQHGQFALTSLVIVDKFGQSIACPFPQRKARPGTTAADAIPQFVHPCLSEQLIPSVLADGTLNTVYTTQETKDHATSANVPMTPFLQLNPAINQEARMNATFLQVAPDEKSWLPSNEWDNPIFGWVIVNYADSSLQFFTADGTFYTSRQFGGPTGTIEGLPWLPFEPPPPDKAKAKASSQLIGLIEKLASANYLQALWEVISSAIPSMPFPPSDYAPYANAIVGKPLALVNAGWSIELSQPPLWSQTTLPQPPTPKPGEEDPLRSQARKDLEGYKFKFKIGDAERPFDGVVAYWDVPDSSTSTAPDYNKLYAYTSSNETAALINVIEPSNFPTLPPYYIDPDTLPTPAPSSTGTSAATFTQQHTAQLLVKTLLVDPYTPMHVYSGILPITSLQLPSWAINQALKNMTSFFAMGPLLISQDVPATYDATHSLEPDTWLTAQTQSTTDPGHDPIRLAVAGGKGMWNWLQPYLVDGNTHYNALAVGQEDGKLRGDPAPYTFVEGYLSLARALADIEVPGAKS